MHQMHRSNVLRRLSNQFINNPVSGEDDLMDENEELITHEAVGHFEFWESGGSERVVGIKDVDEIPLYSDRSWNQPRLVALLV